MTQEFQTSFIPTGNQSSAPSSMIPGGRSQKNIVGTILFLTTLVIFIGTALYTGYSIWYEKNLGSQIDDLKKELAIIQQSIVDGEVAEVEKLNNRLKQSSGLLSGHLAPILLFDMLEIDTLPTITFTGFLFEVEDQSYKITASGRSANFESIVYQSDVYGENEAFRDVLFSDLQRTPDGDVTFAFSTFVGRDSISYVSRDFTDPESEKKEAQEVSPGTLQENIDQPDILAVPTIPQGANLNEL